MNDYQAGQTVLCGDYFQYTPSGAAAFKRAGRWSTTPSRGYIAFFYSASLKRIGHTGIVTNAEHNANGTWNIWTIEGNTSGATADRNGGEVRQKLYSGVKIGSGNWFEGFGIPKYGADTCSAEALISIASGEIGYEEKKNGNKTYLYDKTANAGKNNYTKYGEWYGLNPAQWCAQFVSWCVYQACVAARSEGTGWIQQDNGTWTYKKADGQFARSEWLFIGGRWYVFDGSGTMITGWFDDGTNWYYLADDGAMCSGQWVQDGESWYYLTASGAMAKDAVINCDPLGWCYVGESGVWDGKYTVKPMPGKDTAR